VLGVYDTIVPGANSSRGNDLVDELTEIDNQRVKRRIILRDFCFIILRTQPVSSNEESRKPSPK
jgi:hypothetical protein